MRPFAVFLVAASLTAALPAAQAQKVVLGMSGWTGFSPLSLADKADIFKKNGVDVELRMIPPVPRSAALASGALNAAATTVDHHIVWMSAGIPSVPVALIDKSNGGDGLAVRANPDAGRILVTSRDYPVVIDVLVFRTDFIKQHPQAVKKVVDSFFEAQDMIRREQAKSFELMGSVVKQSGEQFAKSAAFITWSDRASSQAYYAKEHAPFVEFAVQVLRFNRVIDKEPKAKDMIDLSFH